MIDKLLILDDLKILKSDAYLRRNGDNQILTVVESEVLNAIESQDYFCKEDSLTTRALLRKNQTKQILSCVLSQKFPESLSIVTNGGERTYPVYFS